MKAGRLTHEEAVKVSYQLLGLLTVCAHAADRLQEVGNETDIQKIAGGLGNCMDIAVDMAGQLHNALELSGKAVQA